MLSSPPLSSPANFTAVISILRKAAAGTGSLNLTKKAHARAIILGLDRHPLLSSSLISAYSISGFPALSHLVFSASPSQNIFLQNSLLAALAYNACDRQVLTTFHRMRAASALPPDGYTLAIIAKASAELSDSDNGRAIHSLAIRIGLSSDTVLANTLMLLYFQCGRPDDARQLFDEIPHRTVASWNALISGHTNSDSGKEWELVRKMQSEGIKPNGFTVSSLLPLCSGGHSTGTTFGRQIHGYITRHELSLGSELHVGSCLINLYCKGVNVEAGRRVFDREPARNVFTWTAMIAGYVASGEFDDALKLFSSMNHGDKIRPNEVTLVTVLPAVGSLAALDAGKQIHGFAFRQRVAAGTSLNNALIAMYSKCGSAEAAGRVFDNKTWAKDAVSWSSVISCCAIHGMGGEALSLFNKMRGLGIKLDHINGLGVLSACSRSGMVREGIETFVSLIGFHGVAPTAEMCSSMVELLGRAGQLEEALSFISSMPSDPASSIWGALFGAAVSHSDEEIQRLAGSFLIQAGPENPSHHVSLSNFHASFGRWDAVDEVRKGMAAKGLRKSPGLSWINVNGKAHSFYVADKSHLSSGLIHQVLGSLSQEMKVASQFDNITWDSLVHP